jgi:hypothetical protein
MAIREKIADRAKPYLAEGEHVQVTLAAQTMSQWWVLLTFFILLFGNRYRSIVVTDRRILVLDTGRLSMANAKAVVRELPRATRIGPSTGGIWYRTESLGETLRINRRFYKDIERADAAVQGTV